MSKRWQRDVVDLDQALRESVLREQVYPADAWRLLSARFSERRRERLLQAVSARTRHIRLVVQDVHQPHNVSACIRSADAFGVQDVDVVTLNQAFKASTVARGVAHWLTIRRYRRVADCVAALRAAGYHIAAGLPRQDAVPLYDLPLAAKLAVVFGNEHAGIDAEWLPHIDYPFTIPMVGLVESLNISVSCAITLAQLTRAARAQLGARFPLPPAEQQAVLCEWACRQTPSWQTELAAHRAHRERNESPSES